MAGTFPAGVIEAILRLRDEMTPAMLAAGQNMQQVGQQINQVGASMRNAGLAMTAAFTTPLVAAGREFINFESSFAGVKKTLEGSPKQFAALSAELRQMAVETGVSVNEINRVAEAAGQLGVGVNDVSQFTRVMVMMGEATTLSSEEAAFGMARLSNIMGLPHSAAQRLGDVIVQLGNNAAATEGEILEMGLRIAGAGRQIGLTEAQVLAFASGLTSVGIRAEAGGTAISRVFKEVDAAVRSGGANLETFASVAGMSAQQFADAFRKDASQALIDFIAGLGNTQAAGGDVNAVLADLGLGAIRVSDAMLRSGGAADEMRRQMTLANEELINGGALSTEFEQRMLTMAKQIDQAREAVRDIAIDIGLELMPEVRNAVDTFRQEWVPAIKDQIQAFKDLDPETKQARLEMLAFAGLGGPVLAGAGLVLQGIGSIITVTGKLVVGVKDAVLWLGTNLPRAFELAKVALLRFDAAVLTLRASFGVAAAGTGIIGGALLAVWALDKLIEKLSELAGGPSRETATAMVAVQDEMDGVTVSGEAMREAFRKGLTDIPEVTSAFEQMAPTADRSAAALQRINSEMAPMPGQLGFVAGGVHNFAAEIDRLEAAARRAANPLGGVAPLLGGIEASSVDADVALAAMSAGLTEAERNTVLASDAIAAMGRQELPIMTVAIEDNIVSLDVWLRKMGNVGTVASQGGGFFSSIGNFFSGGFSQILKGGLQSIGSAIFSPISSAINAGIGFLSNAIVDAFTNPVWEQAMEDIGSRWGVDISEGLAKQIEADAKSIGDRVAAQLMNLSSIIQEAGGIDAFGLANATAAARDFFVMIETGKLTVAQAGTEFNKVFADIAAHLDPNDPSAPFQQFVELIDLAHRFGVEIDHLDTVLLDMLVAIDRSTALGVARFNELLRVAKQAGLGMAEIADPFVTQFGEALGQVQGLAGPVFHGIIDLMDQMGIKSEAVTAFMEQNTERATTGLLRFIEIGTIETQRMANATMDALSAVFQQMVATGQPLAQILQQLQPALQTLTQKLTAAGLEGTKAFRELVRWSNIMSDTTNGPLVQSVLALNDVLIGLNNTGALTQSMFAGFSQSIADTLDELRANGVSARDAMVLAQPSLQTLWELSTDFGFTLDANTQKWVDMAVKAGLVGEAFRDPSAVMTEALFGILEVLVEIARVFGATIPESIQAMLDAHNRAAEIMAAGIEIPIHYVPTGNPNDFFDPNHPGLAVTITPGSFVGGSGRFLDFGPQGTPAILHGREQVVTHRQGEDIASMVRQALIDGAGQSRGGDITILIAADGRAKRITRHEARQVQRMLDTRMVRVPDDARKQRSV